MGSSHFGSGKSLLVKIYMLHSWFPNFLNDVEREFFFLQNFQIFSDEAHSVRIVYKHLNFVSLR